MIVVRNFPGKNKSFFSKNPENRKKSRKKWSKSEPSKPEIFKILVPVQDSDFAKIFATPN
jgi:hypothetical protein